MTISHKIIIAILLTLFFVIALGAIAFSMFYSNLPINNNQQTSCTMEAKLCPDGSYVGRSGPTCEFTKCPEVKNSFNVATNFTLNKEFVFSDGLAVTLTNINDSRCKSGVVCIWAGELSPILKITGGNVGTTQEELLLGTSTKKQVTSHGYTFILEEATETTASIIITQQAAVLGGCYIGGCSGEVCSDKKDVVSTCIYTNSYACYKTATCERQTNGQCGWTQTPALQQCLKNAI